MPTEFSKRHYINSWAYNHWVKSQTCMNLHLLVLQTLLTCPARISSSTWKLTCMLVSHLDLTWNFVHSNCPVHVEACFTMPVVVLICIKNAAAVHTMQQFADWPSMQWTKGMYQTQKAWMACKHYPRQSKTVLVYYWCLYQCSIPGNNMH